MKSLDDKLKSVEIDGVVYEIGDSVNYYDVHWSSDWSGDEVGYGDIDVVGLYSFPHTEIYMYLNMEDGTILEMWEDTDE